MDLLSQKWKEYYILPMLSISWKEARKHQTNFSQSKSTFGFTKDKRFKSKDTPLCDSFYNIPSLLGRAPASGIGKGSKVPIINPSAKNPSPLSYTIRSPFAAEQKGIKFGLGRENVKANGMFLKSQTPQPGHYQARSSFAASRGPTIYSRLKTPQNSYQKNPGPGHYRSIESLNPSGKYVLSQLTNCPGYRIKDVKQKDFINCNPGPGHYDANNDNLNPTGRYSTSNHENSRCRTFSKSAKTLLPKKSIPGPGSYNYYSQFGTRF